MRSDSRNVEEYLEALPPERREAVNAIRDVINENLPEGYAEQLEWGMITWVVPLEDYPDTYNGKPLSYISLASQKATWPSTSWASTARDPKSRGSVSSTPNVA